MCSCDSATRMSCYTTSTGVWSQHSLQSRPRHPWWSRASNRRDSRPAQRLSVPVEYPSLPIAMGNAEPLSETWLGLAWTPFTLLPVKAPNVAGVYRLVKDQRLLYVGESRSLRSRLSTHSKDPRFLNCEVSYHCMHEALSSSSKGARGRLDWFLLIAHQTNPSIPILSVDES